MSDAIDDVAEAVALTRRLAASRLVRKQDLAAELGRLQAQRPGLDGELAAEVDARIATLSTELAAADGDYRSALADLDELARLGRTARGLAARAVIASATPDPVIGSAEEIALANARDHIEDVIGQARLGDELAETATPPAPAPSAPAADPVAQARAEFEALRARLGKPDPKKTI